MSSAPPHMLAFLPFRWAAVKGPVPSHFFSCVRAFGPRHHLPVPNPSSPSVIGDTPFLCKTLLQFRLEHLVPGLLCSAQQVFFRLLFASRQLGGTSSSRVLGRRAGRHPLPPSFVVGKMISPDFLHFSLPFPCGIPSYGRAVSPLTLFM